MANPNFDPLYSSNRIWRDEDMDRCLTDDMDAIEDELSRKSEDGHTHTGYAPTSHTHTGYAPESHTHTGYALTDHTHTGYAAYAHGHSASEITGLLDALNAKAAETHDHTLAQIVGLVAALAAKADLIDGKIPESQLPSFVDDVVEYNSLSAFPTTGESGKIYLAKDTNKSYRWSGTTYVELTGGVALGETSATAYRGDRGKTAYDHSQDIGVHVTAAQKTAWDSKAAGNHGHAYSDLSGLPTIPTIPSSLPANGGNADTVDNKHASDFALSDHTHEGAYLAKSLQFTSDDGNVQHSYDATDDVLEKMASLENGVHTCYCPVNSVNSPKSTEAWRFMVHKTGQSKNYGWCMAFGSRGSVYSNYIDQGNWRGWKCIHDIEPNPLWTGAMYLTAGHTVTPTKSLSECRSGWMLLWSDYNPGDGENNYDFSTTFIPKRAYTGQKWAGGQFLCIVPCHYASDGHNHITKCIHIHDTKIVGHENNTAVDRNDVVLRAVYEI